MGPMVIVVVPPLLQLVVKQMDVVADRSYRAALKAASERQDKSAMKAAQDELDVLTRSRTPRVRATLHPTVTAIRLRGHGRREARDLLQAPRAAAGLRPGATGDPCAP